jgi:hypothetical protein
MSKKFWLAALILGAALMESACKKPIDLYDYPAYQLDHKNLVVLLTASWSEYAGEAGQPNFVRICNENLLDDVVPLVAHASPNGDPLYSLAASQFYELYQAENFPELGLNTTPFQFRLEEWELATRAAAFEQVGGVSRPVVPKVMIAVSKKVVGKELYFKVRVRVEEDLSNTPLNLAVYVTENDISAYQAGNANLYINHQHVLRGAGTPGAWGIRLGENDHAAKRVYEYEGRFPITQFMNSAKLFVNPVVFEMEGGSPIGVLNANRI